MATDTLSTIFSALADPTRRAILQNLARGPQTVGDIAQPFDMSGPAVCKHLKVLEKAGLIKTDRRAQWRPRSLDAARLREVHAWVDSYRQYWEESFDKLDVFLANMQAAEGPKDQPE